MDGAGSQQGNGMPAASDENRDMRQAPAIRWFAALWAGEVPLPEAFWWYGIALGLVVNAASTLAALALVAAGAPEALALVLYLLPLPYNALILVGVWRAAARWRGTPHWADLARLAIILWVAAAIAF